MGAIISECGTYRYRLDRVVSVFGGPTVALVGVNPSTADATVNDATIRKDLGFGERLGWARIIKANKFAFRATDVRALRAVSDPIGSENDRYLREIFAAADLIVPCWGPLSKLPPHLRERWKFVARLMEQSRKPIRCFGVANDGQPRHTLMLAYDTPLVEWVQPQ